MKQALVALTVSATLAVSAPRANGQDQDEPTYSDVDLAIYGEGLTCLAVTGVLADYMLANPANAEGFAYDVESLSMLAIYFEQFVVYHAKTALGLNDVQILNDYEYHVPQVWLDAGYQSGDVIAPTDEGYINAIQPWIAYCQDQYRLEQEMAANAPLNESPPEAAQDG